MTVRPWRDRTCSTCQDDVKGAEPGYASLQGGTDNAKLLSKIADVDRTDLAV